MCVYIYINLLFVLFLFLLRLQRTSCCTYVCVYNTFVFDDDNLNEKRRQPINQNKKLK